MVLRRFHVMISAPEVTWLSKSFYREAGLVLRGILLCCLALISLGATADIDQGFPRELDARIARLKNSEPCSEGAKKECGTLLKLIESKPLTAVTRARTLDRLREVCSSALAVTDSVLQEIEENRVALWRPLESQEPAALCEALKSLGLTYHYGARSGEALRLYSEAVSTAEKWLGNGTSREDVASALESRSAVVLDIEGAGKAKEDINRSLRLRLRAPVQLKNVAKSLTARARVEEKVDLRVAEKTLLEAEGDLGASYSADKSRVTHNLGDIYYRLGDLSQSLSYLKKAEKMRSDGSGSGRPERRLASTQLLLGQIYFDLGDYPQAIDYYKKGVAGHICWLGKDPYRYGEAVTGLAEVLEESGKWDEALELQSEILKKRKEKALSQQSDRELQLHRARSLTLLGSLQRRMGAVGARISLEQALAIENRVLPAKQSDIDRAKTLLELAEYCRESGDLQAARDFMKRCLSELSMLGERSTLWVRAARISAQVAIDPADGLLALKTLEATNSSAHRVYGEDSPSAASILQVRAELLRRQHNAAGALAAALRAQKISQPQVRSIVQAFPRDQALSFAADRRQSLDLALQLVAENPNLKADIVGQVFQAAASSRMLVRDAEIDRQRLLNATRDPQLAKIAKQLKTARERYAYLLVRTEDDRLHLQKEAWKELQETESSLARETRPLLAGESLPEPSVQQLRRRLSAREGLVAIYRYRQTPGDDAYIAFVLNGSAPLRAVPLGRASEIDGLIEQWRKTILSPTEAEAARKSAGQALRGRIWDPIEHNLGETRRVFLVPDGALYMVSWLALPAKASGQYLIDKNWAFYALNAERDLLESVGPQGLGGPLLAVGGIDYNRSTISQISIAQPSSRELLRGIDSDEITASLLRGGKCFRAGLPWFASLPGSLEEVQGLVRLWKEFPYTILTGSYATEQALRSLIPGKRFVHLATHGFALTDSCKLAGSTVRGVMGRLLGTERAAVEQPVAGLVLSGANDRSGAVRSDEDGILTEGEILDLDLRAADWVVLSACESGLGRIRPGEGVIGILRAFQVAGAKTVIVSLWPVEDQAARIWMQELYTARFVYKKKSTMDIVREATKRSLEHCRANGDDNPAQWAAFVASGH
jgi:CHAT domain-containing protein